MDEVIPPPPTFLIPLGSQALPEPLSSQSPLNTGKRAIPKSGLVLCTHTTILFLPPSDFFRYPPGLLLKT